MRWVDRLVLEAQANLSSRELEALWCRGVSDEQISSYQIGYLRDLPDGSDPRFSSWWRGKKLRDAFVFPLTNALGQVKGLQFRHVEREVKGYLDYFLDEDEPVYFGLFQAMPHIWSTQVVCLVEGVFDLFPIQRVIPNVVPTMTSTVTTSFFRFLRRNVREVWFGYDMDSIGQKGAKDFLEKYGHEFDCIKTPQFPRLQFPDGKRAKDPADMWEVVGDDRFGVYLRSAYNIR